MLARVQAPWVLVRVKDGRVFPYTKALVARHTEFVRMTPEEGAASERMAALRDRAGSGLNSVPAAVPVRLGEGVPAGGPLAWPKHVAGSGVPKAEVSAAELDAEMAAELAVSQMTAPGPAEEPPEDAPAVAEAEAAPAWQSLTTKRDLAAHAKKYFGVTVDPKWTVEQMKDEIGKLYDGG